MKRLTGFVSVIALFASVSAHAAVYDLYLLFDTDRKPTTGCTFTISSFSFGGVEQVVKTRVDVTGGVATTLGVTRQACVGGGIFGSPVTVDAHTWPAGLTPSGNLFIETHVPLTDLGMTPMTLAPMRIGMFVTNGTLTDAVVTTRSGGALLFPEPGRRRAVVPVPSTCPAVSSTATGRPCGIVLDGADSDWAGISPVAEGGPGAPDLRFIRGLVFENGTDIFFGIRLQANHNAPTAVDDSYALATAGGTLNVPAGSGVLANDTDPNGLPLTATLVAGVQHGTLTLNANGGFTYTNDGSPAPLDTFEYKANNGTLDSNTAQVQIGVGAGGGPNPPPTPKFTSADHTTFLANTLGTFTVTTTPAHPTPSISSSGALPTGVTFHDNGDGTATISGAPGPNSGGVYHLVLTATNVVGSATQNFTLTVNQMPNIVSVDNTTFTVGSSSTFIVSATGFPAPAMSKSGALPAGVTFADNGNGTATLQGTPAPGTGGIYTLLITATNSVGSTSQTFTLRVNQAPAFTSANNVHLQAGTPANFMITTSGFPPPAISKTGALPAGVTFTDNGNGTATIGGTPSNGSGGTYPLNLTASNGVLPNATQAFTIVVCNSLTVTNPATSTGTAGAPFSQNFTQSGGVGAVTFTLNSGALPTGLTLATNGTLSGTPTVTGAFPITVKVTDSQGCVGIGATYNLTINCQTITVTNPGVNTGTAGAAFSKTFTQSGGIGTITFTTASTLPAGLGLSTAGVLSGTPTQTGTFPIVVKATDQNGCFGNGATYNLTINCQTITVTKPATNTGTVSTPFSQNFTQTGAIGGATFTTASTLPTGLTLATSGLLSGTPTQPGTFPVVVHVVDGNGCSGNSSTYNLIINCQTITVTNPSSNSDPAGTPLPAANFTFTQSGAVGGATFTTASTLPTGVSLTTAGVLTGTPTQGGSFPISVTVTDGNGCTGTNPAYTLTITCPTITVTNPGVSTGTAGVAFSQQFMQSGGQGTVTFSESGALPSGFTFNTTNGILSGTTHQVGVFPITVTATDQNGCQGTGSTYNLTINCQTITVTNPGVNTGTRGTAFSQTFLVSGILDTVTWSETGGLPAGMTLHSATGVLDGTPSASGVFPLTIRATDTNGCFGTSSYTLTINCQTITVTNPGTTTGTINAPFSQQFTQSGAIGGATFTTASTLPNGLNLATDGTLSGTPTQSGSFPIVVTVTDGGGCTGTSATYNLYICPVVSVTNPANSTGTAGTLFSEQFTQSGGVGTITWSLQSGTLPTGITLAPGTGILSGTTSQTGAFPITVTATDQNGCQGTGATYNLTINCQTITITNPIKNSVQSGTTLSPASDWTFSASGILGTANWTLDSGSLPTGISLGSSTGILSGSSTQKGSFPIVVRVTDTNGCFATSSYTLTVTCPTITITRVGGGSFPAATFNVGYPAGNQFQATCTGCTGTIHWAFQSGTQPPGINLTIVAATLSGIPSATGQFTMTVIATDSSGCTGTATFPFTIKPNVSADSYSNLVNNTEAYVTGGSTSAPATPAVQLSGTLVSNDTPASGVTVDASSVGTFATTQGGSVTIASDGTFKYTPPLSNLTTDTFTYTATSNTGTVPSLPQYAPSTGPATNGPVTVTLNLTNRVWYVKNNGSNGNGQSQSPFNSLSNFTNGARVSPDAANDIIYVYNGNGTTTNQTAGVSLLSGEQLWGEGAALVVNGNTLVSAGTKPQITNATANSDGVTLNDGNTVKGVTITGATRDGIAGSSHAGFTGDTLTIQNNVASGLHLTSMTGTVTVTNATISGNATGLDVNNGTAAISLDNTNSITANAGQASVSIQNRPASAGTIDIGATITDNGASIHVNNNASGTINFTGTQTLSTTTNTAVVLSNNTGATINFSGTLGITTTTGTGFSATGGGTLNVLGTANITTGAAAAGLTLNGMTVGGSGATFNSVNTTGATTGIALTSVSGTVTVNGGTISNGTTGISLSGASTSLSLAGVTITGPTTGIINTTNFGTLTIGASVNVSAATALNLTTGAVSGTFANVSSTGGTNGVNLNAVTGTWGATAGTLTGASGATFNVSGTSGTVTWGGNISQSNGANVVTIAGGNTNTITVNGNVTSSGTSTGLSIGGSSGSYSFNGTNAFSGVTGIVIGAGGESGSVSFSNSTTNTVSGTAFQIDGTSGTVTAAITYNGTINKTTAGTFISVNKLNTGGGSLTMSHAPAAAGNLTNNVATASGISITNSSSGSISISDASVTFQSTAAGFTGSGNTGTINLNGLALAGSGNKAGMLISGGGTINVADGAGTSSITMTGGTGAGIDGTTISYTGTLSLTNVAITGNGTTAVTLTGSTLGGTGSSINNAGPALVLSSVALTNGAGMTGVTSSAGINGISLTGVTGGTYTIGNGGSLSGNSGVAFLVSGGSATLSYAGNISGGTQTVNISSATGGTITLSGAIGSSRILLNSNTGATINFTGALTLSTGANPAFTATAGGTVSSTNANSTLTTTSGIALNVANTTIGASGLTFKSISSSSASSGIVLNTTGAGSLTVTGDGASDPANTTRGNTTAKNGGGTINLGSGGTISGATSSGISLTSTGTVSLTSMNITSPSGQSVNSGANGITASTVGGLRLDNVLISGFTGNSGLRGTNVTNLSMQHTDIDGNGTTVGTETNNNWNVRLDELAGNCGSTCNWANSLFFNSRENIVGITQGVTNLTVNVNMTITNCEFRDTTTFANPANDAFLVSTHANAVTNITATGSTFKNVEVCGFQYAGNDNDSGTVNVRNSIFENTGSDIILAHGGGSGGNSTVTFDTSGNTTRQLTGNPLSTVAFDYFLAGLSGASSVLSGTVKNNTIGNAGVTGSGSHVGDGMDANATGSGTLTVTLGTGPSGPSGSNTIHQIKNGDAFFGEANSGSAKLNIFMHSDSFNTDNATATAGAHLVGGAMSSDSSTLCVDMSANTLNGPGYSGVELDTFGTAGSSTIKLVGMSPADNNNSASIATFINGANTTVSPAASAGFVVISGGQIISGTCGVTFP